MDFNTLAYNPKRYPSSWIKKEFLTPGDQNKSSMILSLGNKAFTFLGTEEKHTNGTQLTPWSKSLSS